MRLYVTEHGCNIIKDGGKIIVEKQHKIEASYPIETITALVLLTTCQISSQALEALCGNNACIVWINSCSEIAAVVQNLSCQNIALQQRQFELHKNERFCLNISKRIINAKLHNSIIMLRRLNRSRNIEFLESAAKRINLIASDISAAKDISELEGLEGYGARLYFNALKYIIPEEYGFAERTKHPPTDYFSSVLSFSYSLIFNELYIAFLTAGFHPYIGFMHRIKQNHPALISDAVEEWRFAGESLALDLTLDRELSLEDYNPPAANGGIYLNHNGTKKLLSKFEKKLHAPFGYVKRQGLGGSVRDTFYAQALELADTLYSCDAEKYEPVIIR